MQRTIDIDALNSVRSKVNLALSANNQEHEYNQEKADLFEPLWKVLFRKIGLFFRKN